MSDEDATVTKVERDEPGLFTDASGDGVGAKQVTFVSWVVAAGAYGYATGKLGSQVPEYAGVFLILGVAIGAGMAGSIIVMERENT